jgi:hypothetical protein
MSQITLYLDESTQAIVEQAARSNGVSKSKWVADLIRKHAAEEWPTEFLELAGKFPDFPLRDPSDQQRAQDIKRIGF